MSVSLDTKTNSCNQCLLFDKVLERAITHRSKIKGQLCGGELIWMIMRFLSTKNLFNAVQFLRIGPLIHAEDASYVLDLNFNHYNVWYMTDIYKRTKTLNVKFHASF